MSPTTATNELIGRTLLDGSGEKIGRIEELYADAEGGQPEWALVHTGFLGMNRSFVPIRNASRAGEDVQVPVSKDQVKDAPGVDPDGQMSESEERRLFEHYGVPYTTEGSTTAAGHPGEGEGGAAAQPSGGAGAADDAMTRSEEELHVGTERRERGRVRLRKYVVTEEVQTTVPVQREEVRVEREPITEANRDAALAGPEISEAEHEVVLHEEEPVVEKRVVPRERVRLEKDTQVDEREVSEEVRKERIEADRD